MEEPEPIPPQPEPPPEPPTPEPAPQPEPPFPQPQPPFPHPTPPPAAAPTGPGPPPLSSGWRPALLGAVGTILVLGVAAGIGVALGYVSADTRPSPVATARLVGLVFFAFHHVGVHTSIAGGPSGFPVHGTITLAFAMLTGTVIALWLLARTGRAIAEHVGGTAVVRGLHGAKVALPYAVIVFAVSWLVRFEGGELTGEGVHASFRVSPLAAFLWPLGLAAVAGFVGGVRSPQGRVWLASRLGSWPTGVVTGGGAMLAIGLGLAFVGLVLLAPVHPDATSAYFGPFKDSVATGLAVVYVTLLFVPNMAAWVLLPSMGSCLTASGSAIGLSGSFCFLSYTQFPSSNVATTGRVCSSWRHSSRFWSAA